MKSNVMQHNLRLNLDIPEHLEVNGYVMNADPKRFKSKNAYIVEALLAGAPIVERGGNDLEVTLTEEQLEKVIAKVTERIKENVMNEVLRILLNLVTTKQTGVPFFQTESGEQTIEEEIDAGLADLALDYFEE